MKRLHCKFLNIASALALLTSGAITAGSIVWSMTSKSLTDQQIEAVDRVASKIDKQTVQPGQVMELLASLRKQIALTGNGGREMVYLVIGVGLGSILFFTGLFLNSQSRLTSGWEGQKK